jgi:glycosyltransferase involved in cell wall biosynthesis
MAAPLSVIILTLNEESSLAGAIESVQWADEVLVVDAESTDATQSLARQLGATLRVKPFEDFSRQRNWAIGEARHDWVLMLDADERLSPALQEEIQQLLQGSPACAAYQIRRINYFMDRQIRYSGWQGDRVIRLFNRSSGTYAPKTVHEKFATTGEMGQLKHPFLHYTYKSIASYLEKHDSYTTAAAREIASRGKKITPYHLLVKPGFHFFRSYLLKLGFLDGKQGIAIAWLGSYSVFMRNLKAWRIQQGETIQQKP